MTVVVSVQSEPTVVSGSGVRGTSKPNTNGAVVAATGPGVLLRSVMNS